MTNESDCKNSSINFKHHWDAAYIKNPTEKLGWYEEKSVQIFSLIKEAEISKKATILNVGVGSSTLIDDLLAENFEKIIANDISSEGLNSLKKRLGNNANNVQFIQDDLINSEKLLQLNAIDLWVDRAVLHFFLKKEEQKTYFDLLKKVLKPNGHVIIAVFALDGAEKCCGLELQRYNTEMLQDCLGDEFKLIKNFNYTFVNPYRGERPYIYTLFQRKA